MAPSRSNITAVRQPTRDSLTLPRILCLHGGGSNARIFRAQCRALAKELSQHFTLVFVDGPFSSEPGPDVTTVYQEFGPYNRWLRAGPHQAFLPADEVTAQIDRAILRAIKESDRQGATGEWVALLGFSQGAKVAASLLLRHQLQPTNYLFSVAPVNFRFAVLMAGRAPLVSLGSYTTDDIAFLDASEYSAGMERWNSFRCLEQHVLRLPTIHVHGLSDPGIELHRALVEDFCSREAKIVEWNGHHRVPIRTEDVIPVVNAILHTARETIPAF